MPSRVRSTTSSKRSISLRKAVILTAVLIIAVLIVFFPLKNFVNRQINLYKYPIGFTEHVERFSREYGVPNTLIYSVINTESGFEPNAHSRADAKGLMQLMDITNEDICKRSGMSLDADIFDPSVNIERGTYYLAYLYRQFGTWQETIAAYNAGIGRVKGWLNDEAYSADGKTLHTIPIDETRVYVERVMTGAEKYREIYFSGE